MSKKALSGEQYQRMTTAPVGPLIVSLGIPSMVATLVTSVYNLADTFFVGRIGTSATAAVGVVFSINMTLTALGFLVATGSSALTSRYLGAKDDETACRNASTAFFLTLAIGALAGAAGIAAGAPLLRLLGATETILPYALDYSRPLLLAAPLFMSSLVLTKTLGAEGHSRMSMAGQVTGMALNILLDLVFIVIWKWGILGAAAATALSQAAAFGIELSFFLRRKTEIRLSLRLVSRNIGDYTAILYTGLPSLARHSCNMLANVVLNWTAGAWGDAAIAAMSLASRMLYLANCISAGMNEGSQPVIGYAHGMKNLRRVAGAFWYAVRVSMISMCVFAVFGIAAAPQMIGLFRDDPQVIDYGAGALRLLCLALPLANFLNSATILFQMVGKPMRSTVLIFGRQLALYIPILLTLPRILGMLGVQLAGPLADAIGFAVALPQVVRYLRGEGKKD